MAEVIPSLSVFILVYFTGIPKRKKLPGIISNTLINKNWLFTGYVYLLSTLTICIYVACEWTVAEWGVCVGGCRAVRVCVL